MTVVVRLASALWLGVVLAALACVGGGANSPRPHALRATQIVAQWESTCAVSVDGDVYCWGRNCHGAPVDGLFNLVCSYPKRVPGLAHVTALALGSILEPDCALDRDGTVWCSDDNRFVRVSIPRAIAIVNAATFACALLADATVMC